MRLPGGSETATLQLATRVDIQRLMDFAYPGHPGWIPMKQGAVQSDGSRIVRIGWSS